MGLGNHSNCNALSWGASNPTYSKRYTSFKQASLSEYSWPRSLRSHRSSEVVHVHSSESAYHDAHVANRERAMRDRAERGREREKREGKSERELSTTHVNFSVQYSTLVSLTTRAARQGVVALLPRLSSRWYQGLTGATLLPGDMPGGLMKKPHHRHHL